MVQVLMKAERLPRRKCGAVSMMRSHHLTPEDVITLSGGDSEAVTADVIVLEESDLSEGVGCDQAKLEAACDLRHEH